MPARTMTRMRRWTGPAILSYGFRPFFLGASVWAVCAMVLWVFMLSGRLNLPTRFDPVSWHAHEFLFGTLGAIIAGFLLTAVPNWTGRLPVTGWRLGVLALVWLAGRVAVAVSGFLPLSFAAVVDLAFPSLLGAVILREIIAGRNWRNLAVLAVLSIFVLADALFFLDVTNGRVAAQGIGLRLGTAAIVMFIALIGGRIIPSFTRNWLVKANDAARPAPPMQRFDRIALVLTAGTLVMWTLWPVAKPTGIALLGIGFLHALRLARWQGLRTVSEPLLLVLHAGYGFVPLGAVAIGCATLWPGSIASDAAQHLWMAGAAGLMTLAVMTRATLGHTGQTLTAGRGTVALYGLMGLSVLARVGASIWPDLPFLTSAAVLWICAYGGFAVLYGPSLLRPTPGKS
ncbi:NnrS family protein [Primorskyibacter marinus]|uniref:NnrS family protein n=1 Tax=Primorskyibacter marinus TaxID=1977320 RepID=UPI000E309175|nr:NnrS family protein [Primorskyibacter marinus]